MSEMKKINDEQMNEIAGGKDYRVQNSNFSWGWRPSRD